jgi:hypothetical protein
MRAELSKTLIANELINEECVNVSSLVRNWTLVNSFT